MNNFNKSLLAVFMISLFSLVSIQSINHIVNGPQVLGDTTGPTPLPTQVCKTGVNSLSYTPCEPSKSGGSMYASYVCYDGTSGRVGDGTCVPQPSLSTQANNACAGHSNCKPTIAPPPISANGVPCEVINSLQRTYCSNIPTPPQPTTICKTGLTAFEPSSKCPPSSTGSATTYQSAKFTCMDNFTGTLPVTGKCYISDQLKSMAFEVCSKHPYCGGPVPTDVVKPTLTPAPTIYPLPTKYYPTPTKVAYPTSTPAPLPTR